MVAFFEYGCGISGRKLGECGINLTGYEEFKNAVVERYHDGSILDLSGMGRNIEANPTLYVRHGGELYKIIISKSEEGASIEEVTPVEEQPFSIDDFI